MTARPAFVPGQRLKVTDASRGRQPKPFPFAHLATVTVFSVGRAGVVIAGHGGYWRPERFRALGPGEV